MQRTVFFISDGTAITTETLGHSLLTQFPGINFQQERIPFMDSPEKAVEAVKQIDLACKKDAAPAIVFISIIDDETRAVFYRSNGLTLDLFSDFMDTLERALGMTRESTVGQAHGGADSQRYEDRIEAASPFAPHPPGPADTEDVQQVLDASEDLEAEIVADFEPVETMSDDERVETITDIEALQAMVDVEPVEIVAGLVEGMLPEVLIECTVVEVVCVVKYDVAPGQPENHITQFHYNLVIIK